MFSKVFNAASPPAQTVREIAYCKCRLRLLLLLPSFATDSIITKVLITNLKWAMMIMTNWLIITWIYIAHPQRQTAQILKRILCTGMIWWQQYIYFDKNITFIEYGYSRCRHVLLIVQCSMCLLRKMAACIDETEHSARWKMQRRRHTAFLYFFRWFILVSLLTDWRSEFEQKL